MTLREFIESISVNAETIFKESGQMLPMYHAINGEGEAFVFPAPPFPKAEAVPIVRTILKVIEATRVAFISEAWMLDARVGSVDVDKVMREGIEDNPDRIEVIMISVEDNNEGLLMAMRRIIRDGDKATLGDLDFMPATNAEGRMVGLLPRESGALH